jgi:hypothetical protein
MIKANLKIDFKKIMKIEVNEELVKKEPKLIKVTEKLLEDLCKHLEKYFKDKHIETKITYKLEDGL